MQKVEIEKVENGYIVSVPGGTGAYRVIASDFAQVIQRLRTTFKEPFEKD